MNTELVPVDSWVTMLPAVGDLAAKVSNTSFVPKALRGKPAEIAACILTGRELGIGPMESLAKIDVIDGSPAINAELMRSLVLRAGHEMRFPTLTDTKVVAEGRRAGSDDWTAVTWTFADAQRSGLAGKGNWTKHPRQMLEARATAELCRLLFADALGGVSLIPDEVETVPTEAVVRVSKVARAPEPVEPPLDTPDVVDAEIVEEPPTIPPVTPQQLKKLGATFTAAGITDRTERLAYVSAVIGRDVTSSKDLDRAEASTVIDQLAATKPVDGAG